MLTLLTSTSDGKDGDCVLAQEPFIEWLPTDVKSDLKKHFEIEENAEFGEAEIERAKAFLSIVKSFL
jgi:hypothetical protein